MILSQENKSTIDFIGDMKSRFHNNNWPWQVDWEEKQKKMSDEKLSREKSVNSTFHPIFFSLINWQFISTEKNEEEKEDEILKSLWKKN